MFPPVQLVSSLPPLSISRFKVLNRHSDHEFSSSHYSVVVNSYSFSYTLVGTTQSDFSLVIRNY